MKCHNCGTPNLNPDGSCDNCGVFCVKVPMVDTVFIYARGQFASPPENLKAGTILEYNHTTNCPPPRFVVFQPE